MSRNRHRDTHQAEWRNTLFCTFRHGTVFRRWSEPSGMLRPSRRPDSRAVCKSLLSRLDQCDGGQSVSGKIHTVCFCGSFPSHRGTP